MVKSMTYREIQKALLAHECKWKPGKGDHVKWYCPCGQHMAVATTARTVSPGVVADLIQKLACLPEGWLQ